jgi:glucosamine kinase
MYVGIDGGASNTRVKALAPGGELRAAAVAGPSSLTLGVPEAWVWIIAALAAVGIGPERFAQTHLACALAGTRRAAGRAEFVATAPVFASLSLCSDGHGTVLGAHAGQPGAAVSIGTGIVGNSVARDGAAHQVGGWGFPVRDEASGAWLGHLVVAEALRVLDGYDIGATDLHRQVIDTIGPSVEQLAAWVHQAPSTRYATLAPLVVAAAAAGDAAGLRLMRHAADEAERLVHALDPAGDLPLCLGGSLALPIFAHVAPDVVRRVQPSQGDACDGAMLIARGLARGDLPD